MLHPLGTTTTTTTTNTTNTNTIGQHRRRRLYLQRTVDTREHTLPALMRAGPGLAATSAFGLGASPPTTAISVGFIVESDLVGTSERSSS
jgi:hypothetical protein